MHVSRALTALTLSALLASCSATGVLPGKPSDSVFAGPDARVLAAELAMDWVTGPGEGVLDSVAEPRLERIELDWLGMAHVRLDQVVDGVPVFGGQLILHLLPSGEVSGITDGRVKDLVPDTSPVLGAQASTDIATLHHGRAVEEARADLQVLRHDGWDYLTWRVQLEDLDAEQPSRPVVFVDAHTGAVVWQYDNLQTSRYRATYDGRNRSGLPGRLERSEGQGPVGDAAIDDAHDHAGLTYDYYFVQEGRDSYDGNGATMISTAHHKRNYDNAFWNGSQMVYGDGDVYFTPLSGSLDVVAHELTHAVTEYSANLIYSGESGGLNEATSDIIGVTVDSWSRGWAVDANTWLVGEDIALPALGSALRYMDNPPLDGVSIDHYADYTSGLDVHYSSGIANRFFYLTVQDPSLSIQDAANIWYRALTVYMTPSTTFAEARAATEDATTDLFGSGSAQLAAVGSAWDAVGVGAAQSWDVLATEAGLGGASGSQIARSYDTPTGATALKFELSGGSGDADLYVRFGAAPTTTTYDCRPFLNGSNETCTFQPAQAGTYHVLINAYATYSGATLTVSHVGGATTPAEVCDDGVDNDLDGAVDCADSDCAADSACVPDEVCDDGVDNDLDGAVDCADSDCAADLSCAEPEDCADGVDNDLDGAVDCDDSDCASEPVCAISCPGGEFTGTLSGSNRDDYVTYGVAQAGLFEAALSGDAGTNFDLHLEYLNGNRWRSRAKSENADSNEFVSYNESQTVDHRWRIRRRSGSGAYTLCVQ